MRITGKCTLRTRVRGQGSPGGVVCRAIVAPHVDGDEVKIRPGRIDDVFLGEVVLDELRAIGTAALPEVEHDALAACGRLFDVLLEIEEALLEPVRMLGLAGTRVVTKLLGPSGGGKRQYRGDERRPASECLR